MKKKVQIGINILIIVIFCAIIFGILAFCILRYIDLNTMKKIDPDQVEKITIWGYKFETQELNASDAETFIKLYNESKFRGREDIGTTPDFGVTVYFIDGAYLRINDFSTIDRNFEVTFYKANGEQKKWYFINNQELYEFVSGLVTDSDK